MTERALTIRQPWADLIMAGAKDVENRTWPVPSTVPQHGRCTACDVRIAPGGRFVVARHECDGGERHAGSIYPDGPFPFRLWVHAGKQYDLRAGNRAVMDWATRVSDETHRRGAGPLLSPIKEVVRFQDPDRRGVLLGSVAVTGCHHADDCGDGEYGWVCTTCGQHDAYDEAGHPIDGNWDHMCPGPLVPDTCSRWAEPDVWHWTLAGPYADLPDPIPLRGRQGLWTLDNETTKAAGLQLARAEGFVS